MFQKMEYLKYGLSTEIQHRASGYKHIKLFMITNNYLYTIVEKYNVENVYLFACAWDKTVRIKELSFCHTF